jgi:hypothetical protein
MHRDEPEDVERRADERTAAMDLAHRAAARGNPVAGSFFGFLHDIRVDPMGAFLEDFYLYSDDDSDDIRPY